MSEKDPSKVFQLDGSCDLVHHQFQFVKSQDPIAGIYGGRGCGKTIALSCLVAVNLMNRKRQIVFGITSNQLANTIIPEVKKRLEELRLPYHFDGHCKLECNGGAAFFYSYENYETVRGLTEIEYLICDEIALAKQDLLAVAGPCCRGNFTPKIRFCSTPRGGSFWNTWIKEGMQNGKIKVFYGTMKDLVERNKLSQESYDMQLQAITDETLRRQEIYGEILDDVIENCIVNITDFVIDRQGESRKFYAGIDFARARYRQYFYCSTK